MRFYEVLTHIIGLLVLERRASYQARKRRFHLDNAYPVDLKAEIIEIHRWAVDLDDMWNDGARYWALLNRAAF
jgi:hypothetical protein